MVYLLRCARLGLIRRSCPDFFVIFFDVENSQFFGEEFRRCCDLWC